MGEWGGQGQREALGRRVWGIRRAVIQPCQAGLQLGQGRSDRVRSMSPAQPLAPTLCAHIGCRTKHFATHCHHLSDVGTTCTVSNHLQGGAPQGVDIVDCEEEYAVDPATQKGEWKKAAPSTAKESKAAKEREREERDEPIVKIRGGSRQRSKEQAAAAAAAAAAGGKDGAGPSAGGGADADMG